MLYVATETFDITINGVLTTIYEGRTLVDDSDEIFKRVAGKFKVARSRFAAPEVEAATATPGEKRGAVA